MTALDYVAAIRVEAAALADGAVAAGLDARVPSCPEWDTADLLEHIGTVHRWAAMSAQREPGGAFRSSREAGIEVPPPDARVAWVREGASLLADTLASLDPETPAWTFLPPHNVGFWRRRQAHETTMHRVDAQLAAGSMPNPIDAAFAADGIDELLWLLPQRPRAEPITGAGETIHLHCTDVEGEWLIRLGADGLEVTREHAKGDVAVRGTASALLCWTMGRGPEDVLEVFGDATLLERWCELGKF
jgi:uncharacterized protein (TIGR03083 family)